ncbi:MAG: hypothetical protein JWQ09_876 [Segetibacter sp.]|nr:hypothetical protein [Segetibacter sp.]
MDNAIGQQLSLNNLANHSSEDGMYPALKYKIKP